MLKIKNALQKYFSLMLEILTETYFIKFLNESVLKGSDDGVLHLEELCFCTLSIV
jgi:hypothetical protein